MRTSRWVILASAVLAVGTVAVVLASAQHDPICLSAEDCWNKAEAVPAPPDDAPVQATLDYMHAQLPYYERACDYNATGLACVTGEQIKRHAIPTFMELQKEEATLKQIEGLEKY